MPLYEYECSECLFTKDVRHDMDERALVICSKCQIAMTKLIGCHVDSYFDGHTKRIKSLGGVPVINKPSPKQFVCNWDKGDKS